MRSSTTACWRKPWSDHLNILPSPLPKAGVLAALTCLLVAEGCRKPEDDLGLSLLDPADTLGLQHTDTVGILAWSKVPAPLQTSGLSQSLVGSYVDPVLGQVVTGLVTELRLSANAVGPADPGFTCDSLVLALTYSGSGAVYGDLSPQVLRVHRLDEALFADSIYKNDHIPQYQPDDLVREGTGAFTPVLDDGPIIGGDSLPAQLRIPLKTALGNELLALWGAPELANNTNFLAYFKGLYVVPDNPGQAMGTGGTWAMNLLNGNSKLTLHYHDIDNPGTPLKFDFIFTSGSVRYTTSVFDRAGTPVDLALSDSTLGQQTCYVQAMGGVRTELYFPSLLQFTAMGGQALARAELVVPVDGDHGLHTPPSQLFAFRKGSDGEDLVLPDQVTGQGSIGGVYDGTAKEYRLNITRWAQGILNGTYDDPRLGLVAGSSGISVNRAVLNGPAHPDRRMRLVLTFTTY